jgi:hypothetical protein
MSQRDPLLKQQIRNAVLQALYERPQQRLKEKLDKIIIRNAVSGGYSHASFNWLGIGYSCDQDTKWPMPPNRLLPAHRPEFAEYLQNVAQLGNERPMIQAFLTLALNAAGTISDLTRLLPSSLHGLLSQIDTSTFTAGTPLPEEKVQALLTNNEEAIKLMRRRMAMNLLI